jgi:hypothetical protein
MRRKENEKVNGRIYIFTIFFMILNSIEAGGKRLPCWNKNGSRNAAVGVPNEPKR